MSVALPGRDHPLSVDQALAVEQIATSARRLDVLVGPAGSGKSTAMAGLQAVWEAEHGVGSVLGLAPSAAAAEVLGEALGIETENTAKWLHEHRQQAERLEKLAAVRAVLRSPATSSRRSVLQGELARAEGELARWQLREGQLVIVDEASLVGTSVLDELVVAARDARAKVVLVGDPVQLSAIDAGGMFAALVRDRDGPAELTDVRRFVNRWEKTASVELRAGSPGAIDVYESHGRVDGGSRDEMLDALYAGWKEDIEEGKNSLMIASDLGTVGELNARAQADRIATGSVSGDGVTVSGGARAGVGDQVVTRQNNRRLSVGKHWVRNGDQWSVAGLGADGSLTLQRRNGTGKVDVPADYVREHVELAYASTAHRAQGRTVDTAHAMVGLMTTREVLYVSVTRGKEANRLYVDTHYDLDPHTSHGEAVESMTAKAALVAMLGNQGAEWAAHEAIRREQHEAKGMERLAAEYVTLATEAQAERFDALLARSGLSDEHLATMAVSEARGPLFAGLRDAEARCLDLETALPKLVAGKSLADAADVASVLHGRVDRWSHAAAGRRRQTGALIAGLIPRAQQVTDPGLARALAERDQAMEERALSLAEEAIAAGQSWLRPLGAPPGGLSQQERWLREVSTVAAYRDRWRIEGQRPLGVAPDRQNLEQTTQRKRALAAGERAKAISASTMDHQIYPDLPVEIVQAIEL